MSKIKFYSFHIAAILVLVVLGIAPLCAAVDVTGNWEGRWTSYDSDSGSLTANMTQSGTILGGRLWVRDTECGDFNNLTLSGTVSGNTITVNASAYCSLDYTNNSLSFTQGTVNGNYISGYYTVTGDGGYYDSGTFWLTRAINIITASAGAGGAIVPTGTVYVNAGSDQTFQINPNTGYRVLDVIVDGASVGAKTSHTFYSLSSNHTITATFIQTHTITASAGPGGSISPSGAVSVDHGATQTFWFTPDPGYRVVSVLYDGELIEAKGWPGADVYNVEADHTLQVLFERIGGNPGIPLLLLDE